MGAFTERKQKRNGREKWGREDSGAGKRGRVGVCHCCSFQALEVEKEEKRKNKLLL